MRRIGLASRRLQGSFRYRRHFCLLASTVLILEFGVPWRPPGVVLRAGLYGFLHATMLVLSLRNPAALINKALFIAAAGGLTMGDLGLVIELSRHAAVLPFAVTSLLAVGLVAAIGASGYALLVRRFWIDKLSLRAMAGLTLGCVFATILVLAVVPSAQARGGLGLAAAWWFAFSAGLLCHDTRIAAA